MFKPRPYDPDRRDYRTAAQKAACERNFRIFKLRGHYAQSYLLTGWRRKVVHFLIDLELRRLGAESETKRAAARRAEWEKA
jgi:hypothetical protein